MESNYFVYKLIILFIGDTRSNKDKCISMHSMQPQRVGFNIYPTRWRNPDQSGYYSHAGGDYLWNINYLSFQASKHAGISGGNQVCFVSIKESILNNNYSSP